jgi:hypothetical protein
MQIRPLAFMHGPILKSRGISLVGHIYLEDDRCDEEATISGKPTFEVE